MRKWLQSLLIAEKKNSGNGIIFVKALKWLTRRIDIQGQNVVSKLIISDMWAF